MNSKINKIKMDIYLYYIKVRKSLFRHHKRNAKVIKKKTDWFKNKKIKGHKNGNEKL